MVLISYCVQLIGFVFTVPPYFGPNLPARAGNFFGGQVTFLRGQVTRGQVTLTEGQVTFVLKTSLKFAKSRSKQFFDGQLSHKTHTSKFNRSR